MLELKWSKFRTVSLYNSLSFIYHISYIFQATNWLENDWTTPSIGGMHKQASTLWFKVYKYCIYTKLIITLPHLSLLMWKTEWKWKNTSSRDKICSIILFLWLVRFGESFWRGIREAAGCHQEEDMTTSIWSQLPVWTSWTGKQALLMWSDNMFRQITEIMLVLACVSLCVYCGMTTTDLANNFSSWQTHHPNHYSLKETKEQ